MSTATQNINTATGMNNVHGEVNFTLNGGTIHGNLHAVCRLGTNSTNTKGTVDGKVTVTVTGGQIKGQITKTQDATFDTQNAPITIP